jgi:hypothetical protein
LMTGWLYLVTTSQHQPPLTEIRIVVRENWNSHNTHFAQINVSASVIHQKWAAARRPNRASMSLLIHTISALQHASLQPAVLFRSMLGRAAVVPTADVFIVAVSVIVRNADCPTSPSRR